MTKVTQIEDKGATIAWSPSLAHPDILALGTKDSGGIGFDDTGGELDLYDLNLTAPEGNSPEPKLLGSVKTQSRFASVSWTIGEAFADRFPMGILAGGMTDGSVHLWNPMAVVQQQQNSLISTIANSGMAGPIKTLQFSSLNPTQLAAGGANGQVIIADLSSPERPDVFAPCPDYKQNTEITALAWNTQVAHIVASAAGDGSVAVWDLNSRKAWCELRCETSGQAVADIAWNPSQGLHLLTASLDDRNPVLKLWDLRASTSMPLATLTGHGKGILKIGWCPHDDALLLSCGKDNRTILWDLFKLTPIADVPNDSPSAETEDMNNSQSGMFGASGLAPAQQRRYDIQWSPSKRGVLATCSLDRKVQIHSVNGLASKVGRPPKWMTPSSSVACAYGGAVVSCGKTDKIVRIRKVVEQQALADASNAFESELSSSNMVEFCERKAATAKSQQDQQMWDSMKVLFETDGRQEVAKHLGFDADIIAQAAMGYTETTTNGDHAQASPASFAAGMSKVAEDTVKKALLVGNWEAAVECCFRAGNHADALMLAACSGISDLWSKTQQRYFESESPKRSYLPVVNAVMRNQLDDIVSASNPADWRETLAMTSTYGQSGDFPRLSIALGDKLYAAGDQHAANICYVFARSLEHSVRFWLSQYENTKRVSESGLVPLHDFIVKVSVFSRALGNNNNLPDEVADLFAEYAEALADQGLLVTAAKYCRGDSEKVKILRDRLYRSRSSQECLQALGSPPPFPFDMTVTKKRAAPTAQARSGILSTQQTSQSVARNYGEPEATSRINHQQGARATQMTSTSTPIATQPSTSLPSGWISLQDPSSGRTYYANQSTGETRWDPPPGTTATHTQTMTTSGSTSSFSQNSQYQPDTKTTAASSASANTNKLASKYGDGFVTSASHPELAYQYGNVGTSNPYSGVSRPGTAKVSQDKAPISSSLNFDNLELPSEFIPIKDGLLSISTSIGSTPLSAADKRQLSEAEKGIAILVKRLARGDIEENVVRKVSDLVNALLNRDFNTTAAIQKNLVNDDWKDHKDWLKGIKFLIQLASKRI